MCGHVCVNRIQRPLNKCRLFIATNILAIWILLKDQGIFLPSLGNSLCLSVDDQDVCTDPALFINPFSDQVANVGNSIRLNREITDRTPYEPPVFEKLAKICLPPTYPYYSQIFGALNIVKICNRPFLTTSMNKNRRILNVSSMSANE